MICINFTSLRNIKWRIRSFEQAKSNPVCRVYKYLQVLEVLLGRYVRLILSVAMNIHSSSPLLKCLKIFHRPEGFVFFPKIFSYNTLILQFWKRLSITIGNIFLHEFLWFCLYLNFITQVATQLHLYRSYFMTSTTEEHPRAPREWMFFSWPWLLG